MKISVRFIIDTLLRSLRLLGLQACDEAMARNRDRLAVKKAPLPFREPAQDKAEQP